MTSQTCWLCGSAARVVDRPGTDDYDVECGACVAGQLIRYTVAGFEREHYSVGVVEARRIRAEVAAVNARGERPRVP